MDKRYWIVIGITGMVATLVSCSDLPWDAEQNFSALNTNNVLAQGGKTAYPSTVAYQQAKLSSFAMNGSGNEITVKPRQKIQVSTTYEYNCPTCVTDQANQIIVGLAGRSAQACIYNGEMRGGGSASFELKAPAMPGEYEVRFRPIQAANCEEALAKGWGEKAPTQVATIAKIIVEQKPKREEALS